MNTISGYLTIFNGEKVQLPYLEAVRSMLPWCDEVVVMDGESTDGTVEKLQALALTNPKLRILQSKYDATFPLMDGSQKQLARMACRGDVVVQLDADEVFHEKDYKNLRDLMQQITPESPVLALPVVNLIGSEDRADTEGNMWKWRASWNHRHWGHGVMMGNRRVTADGVPYSAGDDGCFWVTLPEGQGLKIGGFYRPGKKGDFLAMARDLQMAEKEWPIVWHYGGYDLARKSKMWHTFWKDQWETIRQGPALENRLWEQVMVARPKEDLTDEDFREEAERALKTFLTYEVRIQPPPIMKAWTESLRQKTVVVKDMEW